MFEDVLLRYKIWSFAIFPGVGFAVGFVLQFLLGTGQNAKFEGLMIHILTAVLMTIVFIDIAFNANVLKSLKDKFLYVAVNYMFILGLVLGLLSRVF